MRPATYCLCFAALLSGCERPAPRILPETLGVTAVELSVPACQAGPAPVVDTVASGLEVPWDMAFLPDGRALVTERPGRIRVISSDGRLDPEPWAILPVYSEGGGEVGLMGIDTSPDESAVYVAATVRSGGGNALGSLLGRAAQKMARTVDAERGHAVTLNVFRVAVGERGTVDPDPVVSGIASGYLHGGGALRFGPDGLMYLSNGDAADHWRAQMPTSLRGKLLRFQPDGWVPASNPIPDSPVYALGIRHVQGIGWHPGAGRLLVVDHGPTGLPTEDYRTDHDELNAVSPGANLGWPIVAGGSEGGGLTSPILTWTPALAPAGLAVYSGGHPEWEGSAFVTGLRGTSLRRIVLESVTATAGEAAQGTGAAAGAALGIRARCEETLLRTDFGRLRLVREAPDGSVWVGTSNRDGRGVPREGDDHLLRIRPPGR